MVPVSPGTPSLYSKWSTFVIPPLILRLIRFVLLVPVLLCIPRIAHMMAVASGFSLVILVLVGCVRSSFSIPVVRLRKRQDLLMRKTAKSTAKFRVLKV